MTLPAHFQFSQASLQDYSDCRRRFELRYLERLAWPAIESEPALENELYMQKGAAFHHLVHQHQIGLPAERLTALIKDDELAAWWQRYRETSADVLRLDEAIAADRYPERLLSTELAGYTLLAKLDLLLVQPGRRLRIIDWKTSRKPPQRNWLAKRLQTRVYRFVVAASAAYLNGGQPVQPDQVDMVYWFTAAPDRPEIFPYSQEQYAADRKFLARLIEEIAGQEHYPLTSDEGRCRFCVYRSLCDRGVTAGSLDDWFDAGDEPDEPALDAGLDFDQIAEIEF